MDDRSGTGWMVAFVTVSRALSDGGRPIRGETGVHSALCALQTVAYELNASVAFENSHRGIGAGGVWLCRDLFR